MFSVEVSFTFMPFMFVLISDKWLYFVVFFFCHCLTKLNLKLACGPTWGGDQVWTATFMNRWKNGGGTLFLFRLKRVTHQSLHQLRGFTLNCLYLIVQILLQYWVLMKCSLSGGFNNVWFFSRFAGRTVSSGALVLLSVEMKETSCGLLTINTEKSVMASMLLRDLTHALAQS